MTNEERESLRHEIDEECIHQARKSAEDSNFVTLQSQFDELRRIVEQRNAEIAELKAEIARLTNRLAYVQERVEER